MESIGRDQPIVSRLSFVLFLLVTWIGCFLSYPTFRLWLYTPEELLRLEPEQRADLVRRATVPGIDLAGGYRFRAMTDVARFTDFGRASILAHLRDFLRRRLDAVGILEATVREADEGSLEVDVPLSADTTLVRLLLTHTGSVTFHLFKDGAEVQQLRQRIDAALTQRALADTNATAPVAREPFSGHLASLTLAAGIGDIVVPEASVPTVQALLADTTVQRVVRSFNLANPPAGAFVWASEPAEQEGRRFYPLYFVNKEADLVGQPLVDAQVSEASLSLAARTRYGMRLVLNDKGREDLANISSANVGNRMAVMMQDRILMTLPIQGRIADGRVELPGGATLEETRILAAILRSGLLPVEVRIAGAETIAPPMTGRTSGMALWGIPLGIAGLALLLAYRSAGALALVGIGYQLLMTCAVLRLWHIAGLTPLLTLSTLAGTGLSVLVLIGGHLAVFERIREALGENPNVKTAVAAALDGIRPFLIWLHAVLLVLALVFITVGTGAVVAFALGLFSGVGGSLATLALLTRTVLVTVSSEWHIPRLSI
jgi:protein-export membrane protein SecD